MTYRLKRSERETIIRMAEDEDAWHVWAEVPRHINRFTKRWGPGTQVSDSATQWVIPEKQLSPRAPSKLSDEQKRELAARLHRSEAVEV